MDPGIKPEWNGKEFVRWEAVPSRSGRFGNVDISCLREGDVDRGERAPHKLVKGIAGQVPSLELEAPLQMVADGRQVGFIVIKG